MARKRSKSKSRKRRRKELVESPTGGGPAVALDEDEAPVTLELGEDEAPVTVDLSDDAIVDAHERERLIAAAAGLPADIAEPAAESGDAAADSGDVVAESGDMAADSGEWPAGSAEEVTERAGVAGDQRSRSDGPAMTPAALAALSEIHHEGLASLPRDFVLDLGSATSEIERDRILAAALAHVDMQEAIYRVPSEERRRGGWKGLLAGSLLVAALLVLVRPPAFAVPPGGPVVEATDRTRGVHLALLLQAEQIEAFRSREDRLPDSLADLDHVVPGVRFVRSSNRLYQLVAFGPDGRTIVYDSAAPGPAFDTIERPWTAGGNAAS